MCVCVCLSGAMEVMVGGGGHGGVSCVYVLREKKKKVILCGANHSDRHSSSSIETEDNKETS